MKRIVFLLFISLSLVSCDKECADVDLGKISGTWSEQYPSEIFAFDSILRYSFDDAGAYTMYVSDPDGSYQRTTTGNYLIGQTKEKTITINSEVPDQGGETYEIVKLTSKEMAWQKVGTTYSKGAWGSDYRHFVRM